MKKTIFFLAMLVFLGCGSSKINEDVTIASEPVPSKSDSHLLNSPSNTANENSNTPDSVTKVVGFDDFSDGKKIGAIMNFLASDELQGRDTGSEGIEMAAAFIEKSFRDNNIAPYFNDYRDSFSSSGIPAFNVVGFLEGNDPKLKNEMIIIGAHYDHIGLITPKNGDAIANGANDNASGTTTVLELARYFGNARTNKRSIIFALFSAEEKGLVGSDHLAKKLKAQNVDLYAMLNFEMVGVPLVDRDYFMYISGYEKSNLAEVANSYSNGNLVGFLPSAKEMNLFKRSDNYPFHTAFNVPSQTFCTFDFTNFDHYHQVGDEADIIDFDHMAKVVNKSIPMLEGILNAPTKEIKYY